VGENLLGVAQVVGKDVVIVLHTLSQGNLLFYPSRARPGSPGGGRPSWRGPGSRGRCRDCAAHPGTRKTYYFIPDKLELVQAVQVGEDLLGVAQVVGEDVMVVPHTLL
jgi:hypothetical protein